MNLRLLRRRIGPYKLLLGEFLVTERIITEDDLKRAVQIQKERQKQSGHIIRLGQVIVDMGLAKEETIVRAINDYYGITVHSISDNVEELISARNLSSWQRLKSGTIPISVQLSIAITAIVLTTVVIVTWIFINRQSKQLYDETVQNGKISLNYFVNNAREPLIDDDILKLNILINKASSVEGLLYAIIVDRDQVIKAHTDHKMIGKVLQGFGKVRDMRTEGDLTYFHYRLPSGSRVLNVSRPVTFQGKTLGTVHVGISLDFISRQIRQEALYVGGISLGMIIFCISVAAWLGIGFSRPIAELVEATNEIGKGNYQRKITLIRKDELGDLATAFNYMSRELSMKSWVQETFGRYVSPEILQLIMGNPEKSWLKGTRNEASILFTDIRGFTSFSETRDPERVVDVLNEYFSIATENILAHGGYVDKFIGDAVLGVFGVPVTSSDHAEKAVRAAFSMQQELQSRAKGGNELLAKIGIGINSGVVVSGNIGSSVKMEYTVIGDSVNVASRLNSLAGPGVIIMSRSTYEQVKDIVTVEPLPPQMVKGKSEPIEIFSLTGVKEG